MKSALMKLAEMLHFTNRDDWGTWLKENHEIEKEIWLIYYKKHTGKPNISYDDAVEEALCFGWIDSIIKRIDDEKFIRKFTPRKANSKWSELNKRRSRRMIEEGKMTKAGLKKIEEAKKSGEWFKTAPPKRKLRIPPDLREALSKNDRAQDFFNNLANSYKRNFVGWITSARREETRKRRIREAIRLLEQNEKLGMK